jgi:hypothetical protein
MGVEPKRLARCLPYATSPAMTFWGVVGGVGLLRARVSRVSCALLPGALAFMVGCSSASPGSSSHSSSPPRLPAGLPAEACGAGTMPAVGHTECVAVGTPSCPAGFERSDTGWGCHAVQPASGCTGPTRAALGQTSCLPVDDCTAAFPPAGADVVVTPNAVSPQVSSITQALALVPAGGTIAVDAGTYNEAIELTQPVHIVGRCASKVTLNAGSAERAVYVFGYFPASIQSMTISGGGGAIVASGSNVTAENVYVYGSEIAALAGYGGTLTLSNSTLDAGPQADAVSVQALASTVQSGSQITMNGVEIRGYPTAFESYDPKSVITFERSIVTYDGPAVMNQFLGAWAGSTVALEQSAVFLRQSPLGTVGASLPAVDDGPPAKVTIDQSEVYQSGYNEEGILFSVQAAASLGFTNSTLHYQAYFGFSIGQMASTASIENSVLEADPTFDTSRTALFIGTGGSATLTGSAVVNSISAGVVVGDSGSTLTVANSLIRGTLFERPGPEAMEGGSAIALGVGNEGKLTVTDSSLVENQMFGLYVGKPSLARVSGLLVDSMVKAPMPGGAITVEPGAELALTGGVLRASPESALACGSGGTVVGQTTFVSNHVAVAADSSLVVQMDSAPSQTSMTSVVLYQNQYAENDAKIGPPPTYFPAAP